MYYKVLYSTLNILLVQNKYINFTYNFKIILFISRKIKFIRLNEIIIKSKEVIKCNTELI